MIEVGIKAVEAVFDWKTWQEEGNLKGNENRIRQRGQCIKQILQRFNGLKMHIKKRERNSCDGKRNYRGGESGCVVSVGICDRDYESSLLYESGSEHGFEA